MHKVKHVVPAIVALAFGIGCAHAKVADAPQTIVDQKPVEPPKAVEPPKPQIVSAPTKPDDATKAEQLAHEALTAAIAQLQGVNVFFDYNDAALTNEGKQKLARIGEILAKNARLRIRIDGNCDERGTEDYNIALGQRRAEVARRYLTAMGANESQITTVSFGAEKPLVQGHDESAWSKNRRDEIEVLSSAN
jgi:peptidoglycan-associated lipoprotein